MKGPLGMLVGCLLVVLAAVGFGAYERFQGQRQAAARAHADSLLNASKIAQDSIRRADSLATGRARMVADSLSKRVGALQRDSRASQRRLDSLVAATGNSPSVPRDTFTAVVAGYQGLVAQKDSTIATLSADTLFLVGRIATKDSTIRALNTLLDGNRDQLRKALAPQHQGIFAKAFDVGTKTLALYGLGKLVFH